MPKSSTPSKGSGIRRAALLSLLLLVLAPVPGLAQEGFAERFEQAWRLVSERYWSIEARGVDWDEVGEEYRPRALAAGGEEEFYEVLERMYRELGDDHSLFVPPGRVEEIRRSYGNLPCLAVLGQASAEERLAVTTAPAICDCPTWLPPESPPTLASHSGG
jgi:hypothetical protein